VALEIAILIERISRTKETAIGQPRGTVRLMVDVRQEIMNRAEMYLRHLKDTASPMSRRTLVETALTEYLDGNNNSERDALFTAVAAIRDRQREIRRTLRILAEANLIFVHEFFKLYNPLPEQDRVRFQSQAKMDFGDFMDGLVYAMKAEGAYAEFLRRMPSTDEPDATGPEA
jgi:hypothetical protein